MSSTAPSRQLFPTARWWPAIVVLALLPLWCLGLFARQYWTPDEPREADIAWRMSMQSDWTLAQFGGQPWLEKPPLSYWMSAASLRAFGDSPAAARVPNLLYALLAALATATLGASLAGQRGALVSALVAGSALLAWRVAIWLAPDAALLAGCAIALLGAYRGYCAPQGSRKLLWYTLMHAGAALGFMAKSAPGWLVPGLALATLIVWEQRWSELRRPELYAGLVLQLLTVGAWIARVALLPDGAHSLQVLFWNNLAGRFAHVSAPAEIDYALGHKNWIGKYFLELPLYLLPWSLLAVAALRRAWGGVRLAGAAGTAWRFAIAASLPFLLLLSVATTARDVYAAPAIPGIALLIALWGEDASANPSLFDRRALQATRWLVALVAALFAVASALATRSGGSSRHTLGTITALAALIAASALLLAAARAARRGALHASGGWTYAAFAAALGIAAGGLFSAIDRWQDLPSIARAVRVDLAGRPLALLQPDETTMAMLDLHFGTAWTAIRCDREKAPSAVAAWLRLHPDDGRILVLLPGDRSADIRSVLGQPPVAAPPPDGLAGELQAAGVARIIAHYAVPLGRRYALLGAAHSP
jgi:4-amino-4-deoxy-L-arabinose transferase-like glycosyltransferase